MLLVDEAHNLVDRGREMYSASLTKAPFLALQRQYKTVNPRLSSAAKAVNAFFIALRKSCGDKGAGEWKEYHAELPELLELFASEAELELLHSSSLITPPAEGKPAACWIRTMRCRGCCVRSRPMMSVT